MRMATLMFASVLALTGASDGFAQDRAPPQIDEARVQAFRERAGPLAFVVGMSMAEEWSVKVDYRPFYNRRVDGLVPGIGLEFHRVATCGEARDFCGFTSMSRALNSVTPLIDAIDRARTHLASRTPLLLALMPPRPGKCSVTGPFDPEGYVRVDPATQRVRIQLLDHQTVAFDAAQLEQFRALLVTARDVQARRQSYVDEINRALPPPVAPDPVAARVYTCTRAA